MIYERRCLTKRHFKSNKIIEERFGHKEATLKANQSHRRRRSENMYSTCANFTFCIVTNDYNTVNAKFIIN